MIVIGLSAKAQHGKGSTVQLAQIKRQVGDDEFEVRQVSFASALKKMAKGLVLTLQGNPPSDWDENGNVGYPAHPTGESVAHLHLIELGLPPAVADQVIILARDLTVDDLKAKTPQARKLLQFIGTEAFRKHVDDLYWVKRAAEKIRALPPETEVVFIPDCRFPNEADFVRKEMGGEVWRLERFAVVTEFDENMNPVPRRVPFDNGLPAEAKAHKSEIALDDYKFDRVIRHVTMDDLFRGVSAELKRLGFA